jgi:hypothetical protein
MTTLTKTAYITLTIGLLSAGASLIKWPAKSKPTLPAPTVAKQVPHEPTTFKGLKYGMTLEEAKAVAHLTNCRTYTTLGVCSLPTELLKFRVTFEKNKSGWGLYGLSATFPTEDLDEVEQAFTAKYGPPKSTSTQPVTNALGSVYMQRSMLWHSVQTLSILIVKFASSSSKGPGGHQVDLLNGKVMIEFPESYPDPNDPSSPPIVVRSLD